MTVGTVWFPSSLATLFVSVSACCMLREGWEGLSGGYLPHLLRLRVDDLLRKHVSVMEDSAGAELPKKLQRDVWCECFPQWRKE